MANQWGLVEVVVGNPKYVPLPINFTQTQQQHYPVGALVLRTGGSVYTIQGACSYSFIGICGSNETGAFYITIGY